MAMWRNLLLVHQSSRRRWLTAAAVMAGFTAGLAGLASRSLFPTQTFAQTAELDFDPVTVIRQPFPPIVNAHHVPAAESITRDSELVLGVTINGDARAYPVNMLTGPRREIVNDQLGGQAIAATW